MSAKLQDLSATVTLDSGDLIYTVRDPSGTPVDRKIAYSDLIALILGTVDVIQFDISHTPGAEPEGQIWWNATDFTLNISTGKGPVIQVGQEILTLVYNGTVSQIDNGDAVNAVATFGGRPSVTPANSTAHNGVSNVSIATMDIPASSYGFTTSFGLVRGIDTTAIPPGAGNPLLYVDPANPGKLTRVRPEFPNWRLLVGAINNEDAVNGVLSINIKETTQDTIINFWNGVIRETIKFTVASDGATITGSLVPQNGHDDLTLMFSDGFTILDTNPAKTIALTAGTDTNPQTNYVYILDSTKALAKSISDWPTAEHIKVATIVLRSAATTELEGALRNQNWNDHLCDTTIYQGHLSHMAERLRQENSKWESGAAGTATINAGTNIYLSNTAGVVYQMHRQSFPLLDTTDYTIDAVSQGSKTFTISDDGDLSSTFPDGRLIQVNDSTGNDGLYTIASTLWSSPDFIITVVEAVPSAVADGAVYDDVHIVNDFTNAFTSTNDLATITTDASGVSLTNTSYSVVTWGVMNKTGQASHMMANMPVSTYNKNFPDTAVTDASNNSVYDIPKQFQGVGFLIARYTFVNNGGTISLYDTEDLRGKIPNTTAGGGAGGTGVTDFTGLNDTPSAYTSAGGKPVQVNSGATALEFLNGPTNRTQALSDAATVTVDFDSGFNGTVTVAGDRAMGAPSNITTGSSGVFTITCDGTARTLTWNAVYRLNGATGPSTALAASSINKVYWDSPDGTNVDIDIIYGV